MPNEQQPPDSLKRAENRLHLAMKAYRDWRTDRALSRLINRYHDFTLEVHKWVMSSGSTEGKSNTPK